MLQSSEGKDKNWIKGKTRDFILGTQGSNELVGYKLSEERMPPSQIYFIQYLP
jgi:hypothetical protein